MKKVVDIVWETDGADVQLPTEMEIPDNVDDDSIADYLSDETGFLVNSYSVK